MKGELSDEEDKEKYCVDFLRKGFEQDESLQPQNNLVSETVLLENETDNDDTSMLFNLKPVGLGRTTGAVDNDEHKRIIRYRIDIFLFVHAIF